MLRSLLTLGVAAALFTVPTQAQCNASLGVTQSGSTVTVNLTGATPNAFAFAFVGQSSATMTVNFGPIGSATVLAPPAIPVPIGMTDASGNASFSADLGPVSFPCTTLYGQGLAIGFDLSSLPPAFSICASNVSSFEIGC